MSILAAFRRIIEAWASLSNTVLSAFFEYKGWGLNRASIKRLWNIVDTMSWRTAKKEKKYKQSNDFTIFETEPVVSSSYLQQPDQNAPMFPCVIHFYIWVSRKLRSWLSWMALKSLILQGPQELNCSQATCTAYF